MIAAFVAGLVAAVGVSLDPSSWTITEPFFGLPEEFDAASAPAPAPPQVSVVAAMVALTPPPAAPDVRTVRTEPTLAPPPPATPAPTLASRPTDPPAWPKPVSQPTLAEPPPPTVRPSPPQLVRLEPQQVMRMVPKRAPSLAPPLVSVADEHEPSDEPVREAEVTDVPALQAPPAAPLPGANWSDPDGVNWVDEVKPSPQAVRPPAQSTRMLDRLTERLTDERSDSAESQQGRPAALLGDRLRSRLRGEGRLAKGLSPQRAGEPGAEATASDGWPTPVQLLGDLEKLAAASGGEAGGAISGWATTTLDAVHATLDTHGPDDPRAADPLLALGERVAVGMAVADNGAGPVVATQTRRAALAVARRVAVWRAAAAWCSEVGVDPSQSSSIGSAVIAVSPPASGEARNLLSCLERYEASASAMDAAIVRESLASIAKSSSPTAIALARAVSDHYHAANVRIAVHRDFVSRMLPESTVTSNAVQEFVLGRPVKGRSTVEQSLAIRFVPHPNEIRMELVVNGEVASRTVTESGPVAIHSRGQATFTVHKPITVTPSGIAFGNARGTALSNAQLASIETSFDNVPIMGSLVRSIAKTQHDEAKREANRAVSNKVLGRACRQVDQEAGPKLSKMAENIREKLWRPLVTLGLEPTPVSLETTDDLASVRLRLAASSQLAAHTPRPRAPADALVSFQVHETVANNAVAQFGFAGQRLELPELARLVCERLGLDPQVPDDLPDGVVVTFASSEPLRLECRDGLVHVRVALEAFEYGRRSWYDVVAKVAYRPVVHGAQVTLEREGPVQISGPGHQGRMEIGLRTVFGKIFAQSRPVPLVPAKVIENPRLAALRAVQAVATDGWLAIALAEPQATMTGTPAPPSPTASAPSTPDRRFLRR